MRKHSVDGRFLFVGAVSEAPESDDGTQRETGLFNYRFCSPMLHWIPPAVPTIVYVYMYVCASIIRAESATAGMHIRRVMGVGGGG